MQISLLTSCVTHLTRVEHEWNRTLPWTTRLNNEAKVQSAALPLTIALGAEERPVAVQVLENWLHTTPEPIHVSTISMLPAHGIFAHAID